MIGTRATVGSGAYERAIRARRPDAEVLSRPCPLFVPLAEEGWTDNAIARAGGRDLPGAVQGGRRGHAGAGLHPLPAAARGDRRGDGHGVRLVDSAESVAAEEARRLLRAEPRAGRRVGRRRGEHHFFVTDAPEPFQAVAERFLGRSGLRLERASVEGE